MNLSPEAQVELLCRGCANILSREELLARLRLGRPLRVKLGVDPTAPDIHFGHTVALRKLRQFQDLGHQAILIIGDFTARIGDPTGRSATRPELSQADIETNARTYQEQAFKILSPERVEVVYNGAWFNPMTFAEVLKLNSRVTLQQMLQREDFRGRLDQGQPVRAHELQYPIMQGWDSVVVRADVELGGTDQLFNVMVGRDLQHEEGQPRQVAMLLPILTGLDGVQKMSKSLGNAIGVTDEPQEMFGKIMSLPDEAMGSYFELLLQEELPGEGHPMEAKKRLARTLTAQFHGEEAAAAALEDFTVRFSRRDLAAADLPELAWPVPVPELANLVVEIFAQSFGQTKSKSEARRLIEQGSVQWKGEKLRDAKMILPGGQSGVLRLDKTRAVRLRA
jgi:tyrosyl-tRNA synthetase